VHAPQLLGVAALVLALATASIDPVPPYPRNPSVEVDGYEALTHKPLIVTSSGGPWSGDCLRGPDGDARRMNAFFAAYEDGLIIYTRAVSDGCEAMAAHVTPERAHALVGELVDIGVLGLPYLAFDAGCADAPVTSILLRVENAWHEARAYAVDGLGEAACRQDPPPHPALVHALQMLAAFDPPDAVPWVPREFAILLTPGEFLPEASAHAVPWPDGLPAPVIARGEPYPEIIYDARYLDAAQSIGFAPVGYACAFVVLDGRTWAYHVNPRVLPSHAYIAKVRKAFPAAPF
jgi:hypothetical protein